MGRQPRSKRTMAADGTVVVAGKNPNGKGSVYFAAASRRADGTEVPGRWRASYLGNDGQRHVVSGPTRAIVEARRDEILQQLSRRPAPSRFDRHTTVDQLVDWWLGSVAKHQVKQSTLDSYTKFALYLTAELGSMRAVDVGAEALTAWQSRLLDSFAPYTVLNCRKVCRQVFQEAVKVGLLASNPFDMVKAPKAKTVNVTKALSIEQAQRLVTAAADYRLGAAITLLFCQGWRISEVLGLAWEDLDLDAGTARIQRAAAYSPSTGVRLGNTKTTGAEGVHHLAPISVAHLRAQREQQAIERQTAGREWVEQTYEGRPISPVFTTVTGGLVNRQKITKVIERAAKAAGLDPTGIATHTGRRTVITALYAQGGIDLADVARHVGHSQTSTTAGYVRSLGERPKNTARRAAELLDPTVAVAQKGRA